MKLFAKKPAILDSKIKILSIVRKNPKSFNLKLRDFAKRGWSWFYTSGTFIILGKEVYFYLQKYTSRSKRFGVNYIRFSFTEIDKTPSVADIKVMLSEAKKLAEIKKYQAQIELDKLHTL